MPSCLLPTPIQIAELHNILRSNAAPVETMAASFRSAIDACRPELARYDAEIQRLQTLLSGLVSDRTNLVSYIAGCQSALAPIRRLPTELLTNIFEMGSPPIEIYDISEEITPAQELDRLAQRHLLQLSQVSSGWHRVVMSTPSLWSMITVDMTLWHACPVSSETLLSLLSSALIRGQSHRLKIQLAVKYRVHSATRPVLELLARHARRWHDVFFWIDCDSMQWLSAAKGNLHLLERLNLSVDGQRQEIDFFEVAPRLKEVIFLGRPAVIPHLPWGQLQEFQYSGETNMRPSHGLALIQNLAPGTTFTFAPHLPDTSAGTAWPPVSSNIRQLILILHSHESSMESTNILGQILGSLTLPSLDFLEFTSPLEESPTPEEELLVWHQASFLALASRSSFHTHLTTLDISILITEDELVECLAVLPLLEDLSIADPANGKHILITDTLLHRLARKPQQPPLVPHLQHVCLISFLWFTDSIFLDFVTSRIGPGRSKDDMRFRAVLEQRPACNRELGPDTTARLSELESQGELWFDWFEIRADDGSG
ncbi:hypothetical protein DFH07DRAFT_965830 [Mycena maculata]|uniref:F-box domain-containing protein n=1 Tax=Mycena maculata TaxID=230809 RepID=A0AAD7IBD3_9AGAR|nr:hypothetical protein DFH07DRAFT_965830 [Mycena maculata]